MKISIRNVFFFLLLGTLPFISCRDDEANEKFEEVVVTANRGSGNITFINAENNSVMKTLDIPNSEPMYAVYVAATDRLYVGDRSQNRVHVIDPSTQSVETSIGVGNGVFHMWADGQGKQLWVNNDVDFTTSVINLSDNTVNTTIDLGIKPHDVFVNDGATMAYVSVFTGDPMLTDSVYAFSTSTFERVATQAVAKDPHLFHIPDGDKLYVPCQGGTLFVLDGTDLSETTSLAITNSHGIFGAPARDYIYVADISNSELYSLKTSDNSIQAGPVSTPAAVAHNLAVNEAGDKLFVTHSGGSATLLSTYTLDSGSITNETSVTVGTNPFGLAYYKRQTN